MDEENKDCYVFGCKEETHFGREYCEKHRRAIPWMSISDANKILLLSIRATNCLRSAGKECLRDFLLMSDQELLSIKNLGQKTLDEIREMTGDLDLRAPKPLPFKMRTETRMEKYRAETFWTKEPETLEWIRSFDPHDVFFDVGANVGVYSLYAASLFPEMKIRSFEPMRANFSAMLGNTFMNHFWNIHGFPIAIGDRIEMMDLEVKDDSAGASGGQLEYIDSGSKMPVPCMTIDYVSILMGTPTHVKIDIDGQELEVVKGMQNTLPHIKSCLIEVSKASRGPIVDIMTAAGFRTNNRFNAMTPHSRERRAAEGIDAENIVFTR